MPLRRWLPVATTLIVVFGLVWWSRSREPDPDLEAARPPVAPTPAEPRALTEIAAPGEGERAEVSEPVDAPPAPTEHPSSDPAATGLLTVRGTWTVTGDHGLTRNAESGRFVVDPFGAHEPVAVDVHAGRWTASLPRARFDVKDLVLGGRRAVPVERTTGIVLEQGLQLDLVAIWVRDTVLVVVDEATQIELAGVELIGPHPGEGPWAHPGPYLAEHVLASDARSPLTIPALESAQPDVGEQRCWVRAPDHAFATLLVPRAVGGEFLVALGPAGVVAVTVRDVESSGEAWLRVRDASAPDLQEADAVRFETRIPAGGSIELESFAVGSYLVTLELGHRYSEPRVIASEAIVLEPDARVEVVLTAEAPEPVPTASMAGRLVVPPEWELTSFGIYFRRVDGPPGVPRNPLYVRDDQMQLEDAERGTWVWRASELEVGTWLLNMNPLGTSLTVELPLGGVGGVLLEVPPPTHAVVDVIDAVSGEPVADARLFWRPSGDEHGGVLNGAGVVSPGRFRLRAPEGPVALFMWSETHHGVQEVFTLVRGENLFTLKTRRGAGILLGLRDGATFRPLSGLEPSLTPVGGVGETRLLGIEEQGHLMRIRTSEPGLWRVELPAIPGYRPVPVFEIDVPAGEFVEHVVELERGG